MIPKYYFKSESHCDFRYLDAANSYTQISLLHRTHDYWYFQGLIQSPAKPLLGFGFAYHKAFYYSCLSTATFTCDNFSTTSLLSPYRDSFFQSPSECGPLSTSILVSFCAEHFSMFLSLHIECSLH